VGAYRSTEELVLGSFRLFVFNLHVDGRGYMKKKRFEDIRPHAADNARQRYWQQVAGDKCSTVAHAVPSSASSPSSADASTASPSNPSASSAGSGSGSGSGALETMHPAPRSIWPAIV